MESVHGFIYIRTHPSYAKYDGCKLGKTANIPDRDTQYATGEITRGAFCTVIEMPHGAIGTIEILLQRYFSCLGHHIKHDGGTEFFKLDITGLIVPYLEKTNIQFRVLSGDEIAGLLRTHRIKNLVATLKPRFQILPATRKTRFTPRPDQALIVNEAVTYFQIHDKGLLILTCGIGKTLISLWISLRLSADAIIIGVPNTLLLHYWTKVVGELFPEMPILRVSGGMSEDAIRRFLEKYGARCIVITTYSSAHKVRSVAQDINFKFDIKIPDEVHHLTSHNMQISNTTKTYIQMLAIPSKKQLGLTATLKQLEGDDTNVISNDNVIHFGEIIAQKNLLWAINNNYVCDYVVQTVVANEEHLSASLAHYNLINDTDKRLWLSAYAALKSIATGHSHHILIYSNTKKHSQQIIQFVELLLINNYFDVPDLYYASYHSEMVSLAKSNIVSGFENASQGIISCVKCLGEGWDCPLLDATVFAENMTSPIRIVQSALRGGRKYMHNSTKIAKIILPVLDSGGLLENNDNPDLKKVREVVYQMGLEDSTIIHKLKVLHIEVTKHKPAGTATAEKAPADFGEYDDDLTQKLLLKTIGRSELGLTYEKTRKILAENHVKSRSAYLELCERDIRLHPDPERIFKSQFTTWIDFLGIHRIYYPIDACKNKVAQYIAQQPAIRAKYLDLSAVCGDLCKLDPQFPPDGLWVDYYGVGDLRDVIDIVPKKKKFLDI